MSLDLIEKALRERSLTKVAQQVNQILQPVRDLVTAAGLDDAKAFGLTTTQIINNARDALVKALFESEYQAQQAAFLSAADQVPK